MNATSGDTYNNDGTAGAVGDDLMMIMTVNADDDAAAADDETIKDSNEDGYGSYCWSDDDDNDDNTDVTMRLAFIMITSVMTTVTIMPGLVTITMILMMTAVR